MSLRIHPRIERRPEDPALSVGRLADQLSDTARASIHEAAGKALQVAVRSHILDVAAPARHESADRLGARRSGHLEAAGDSVDFQADSDGAAVSVSSPGFARVFGPLTIRPRRRQALTIPVHALAYGRTVAEVARERPVFRPQGKDYLATARPGGPLTVLYVLRQSVTIPQDRGLLPSDGEMSAAAADGVRRLLDILETAA